MANGLFQQTITSDRLHFHLNQLYPATNPAYILQRYVVRNCVITTKCNTIDSLVTFKTSNKQILMSCY